VHLHLLFSFLWLVFFLNSPTNMAKKWSTTKMSSFPTQNSCFTSRQPKQQMLTKTVELYQIFVFVFVWDQIWIQAEISRVDLLKNKTRSVSVCYWPRVYSVPLPSMLLLLLFF
jgi:hypothetical protein